MKNLLISFLLCTLAFMSQAQPGPSYEPTSNPEADAFIQKTSAKHEAMKNVRAAFTLHIEEPGGTLNEKQSGVLHVMSDMFRLQLAGQEIFCDGQLIWTFLSDVNEVQINYFEKDEEFFNPSELFTFYKSNFIARFRDQTLKDFPEATSVELTPIDKELPYFKVILYVDSDYSIIQARILENSGLRYTYVINEFESDLGIDESHFKFSPEDHEGVEVIDLR